MIWALFKHKLTRVRRMSDAYHSCYVLSGLSAAQHQWDLAAPAEAGGDPVWTAMPYVEDDGVQVFEHGDLVRPIHPVYTIPQEAQQGMREYFLAKEGF